MTRDWYRRSGATLPFADPARFHGVAMEGSFWRFTHAERGEVTIVLRGDCQAADGTRWALIAVAAHPGGVLRWAIVDAADARSGVGVRDGAEAHGGADARGGAEARLADGPGRLRVAAQDVALDAVWAEDVLWPASRAFGGLGPAQSLPWLGQYWHPHLLRGAARGTLRIGDETRSLDGASVYAEANWGSTFAGHWWWGQAHTADATVAFAGGRLLGGAPTALVVAYDGETLRFTPPFVRMRVATAPGRWWISTRGPRHTVHLEAEADPQAAFDLPVPVPAERRVILRSAQHLTGRLQVTVRRGRRVWLRGETSLAGLERGAP